MRLRHLLEIEALSLHLLLRHPVPSYRQPPQEYREPNPQLLHYLTVRVGMDIPRYRQSHIVPLHLDANPENESLA